jgi:hypothetical protein
MKELADIRRILTDRGCSWNVDISEKEYYTIMRISINDYKTTIASSGGMAGIEVRLTKYVIPDIKREFNL